MFVFRTSWTCGFARSRLHDTTRSHDTDKSSYVLLTFTYVINCFNLIQVFRRVLFSFTICEIANVLCTHQDFKLTLQLQHRICGMEYISIRQFTYTSGNVALSYVHVPVDFQLILHRPATTPKTHIRPPNCLLSVGQTFDISNRYGKHIPLINFINKQITKQSTNSNLNYNRMTEHSFESN